MLILGSHLFQECIEGLPLAVFYTRFPEGWYAIERFVVKPVACTSYGNGNERPPASQSSVNDGMHAQLG